MNVTPTIQHPHGLLRSITGTNPATGAEISETVPDRRRWLLRSIYITFTTSAVAANRQIRLVIDDGSDNLFLITTSTLHTASLAHTYTFANFSMPEVLSYTNVFHALPPLVLPPGSRIKTITLNLDPDDNYDAPQLLIEEWIDP